MPFFAEILKIGIEKLKIWWYNATIKTKGMVFYGKHKED